MKTITHDGIITSIGSRVDGSLGYRVNTPSLTPQEKALFFELQNINITMSITPKDEVNAPEYKVSQELDEKRPSTRLRNVIFILYRQSGDTRDFELYYKNTMEVLIQKLKDKIDA
jgi:hypothetical protein